MEQSPQNQTVAKTSPKMDIIGLAPSEINIIIAEYLGRYDILACLAVSKQWRMKFYDNALMFSAVKRFFPSLIVPGDNEEHTSLDYSTKFDYAIHLSFNRDHGRHKGMLAKTFAWKDERFFTLDPDFHPGTGDGSNDAYLPAELSFQHRHVANKALYADGKIAWMPTRYTIVLDNLQTKMRKIFLASSDAGVSEFGGYDLVALGDELVVMVDGHELIAWDHKANRTSQVILPIRVSRCVTEGQSVVAMHDNSYVFWSFNGMPKLVRWEFPKGVKENPQNFRFGSNHGVMIHPKESDVWFLVTACETKTEEITSTLFKVHEYKIDELVRHYSFIRPGSTFKGPLSNETEHHLRTGLVRTKKADAFGTFSISIVINNQHKWLDDHEISNTGLVDLILFDTINRKFSSQRCVLPALCFHGRHHTLRNAGHVMDRYQLAYFLLRHQPWNDTIIFQDPVKLTDGYARLIAVPTEEEDCSVTPEPDPMINQSPITTSLEDKDTISGQEFAYDLPIPGELESCAYDRTGDYFETCPRSYHSKIGSAVWGRAFHTKIIGDNDFVLMIEKDRFTAWSFHSDFRKTDEQDPQARYPRDLLRWQ